MWRKRLRFFLPHAQIALAGMFVVFFGIDRVNEAMNFINNDLTKGCLLAMCLLSIVNAVELIALRRAVIRARNRRARANRSEGSRVS